MPSFEDRLRDALGPRYILGRLLGSGGMGVVYLARDTHLECDVAVKALRPEDATATVIERFRRESTILAKLRRPHIVIVLDASPEDAAVPFYIMEYLDGETLAQRLEHGALAPHEARRVSLDLLTALAAAHERDVIHRDVKPGNLFFQRGRGVLTDFGVARQLADTTGLTGTGRAPLTAAYVAPEERPEGKRREIGKRTDLYKAAMVIYEATSGEPWIPCLPPDQAEWPAEVFPPALAAVLQRGLQLSPTDRWPDAAAFRDALERAYGRPRRGPIFASLAGLATLALLLVAVLRPAGAFTVGLQDVEQRGGPAGLRIGDSIALAVRAHLGRFADVTVTGGWRARLKIAGSADVEGDSVVVRLVASGKNDTRPLPAVRGAIAAWPVVAESLTDHVVTEIWNRESPLGQSDTPLPVTPEGKAAWLTAERLIARGQWTAALDAYRRAVAIDSTCWLCYWRLTDVDRWLGFPNDSAGTARYVAHLQAFPPRYQSLIRASLLPLAARLDTLGVAARRDPGFFLAWFHLGDELFHRGPLLGLPRDSARVALKRVVALRPDYAPGQEHLSWVQIAAGDSAAARASLQQFEHLAASGSDSLGLALRALLEAGFAWRFYGEAAAARATGRALASPEVAHFQDLAAGPRMLPTFEAPRGAVWVGTQFAARPEPELQRSGLIAAILGLVALGRTDSAAIMERRLRRAFPEVSLRIFTAELDALQLLEDPTEQRGAAVRAGLDSLVAAGSPDARRRASWMRLLLARGRPAEAARRVIEGDTGAGALRQLLAAEALARRGEWDRALDLTAPLEADTAAAGLALGFRTVLHFDRADWLARRGDRDGARAALRWHEASAIEGGRLTGDPQAVEIDWAFRTLARWRLIEHAGAADADRELCAADRSVARLWSSGDATHAGRAALARDRAARRCPRAGPS